MMSPTAPRPSKKHSPQHNSPMSEREWECRQQMWVQQLEDAKTRTMQMEKTMRWWSDCTSNWREKWSKVRNERNKAREENRHLRGRLEVIVKECAILKQQNHGLRHKHDEISHDSQSDGLDEKERISIASSESPKSRPHNVTNSKLPDDYRNSMSPPIDEFAFVEKLMHKKDSETASGGSSDKSETRSETKLQKIDAAGDGIISRDDSIVEERLSLLQLKLEEAQKTIQAERDEKVHQMRILEELQTECSCLKSRYEDVQTSRQELIMELDKLKAIHQDELGRFVLEREDESSSRCAVDKRLSGLRKELERLQTENAAEWGKRERLETEKLALERDNKKLHTQMGDLVEQLERKNQQSSAMLDSDMKSLQCEIAEKTKELNDLRHSHGKHKKALQERTTELEHTRRRAEQYEFEVKKLRGRVEELKRDLTIAEDEVDTQTNAVRKLQRNTEELTEQVDNLQISNEHLESRLRRVSAPLGTSRSSSMNAFDGTNIVNNDDTSSSEDDDDDEDDDLGEDANH